MAENSLKSGNSEALKAQEKVESSVASRGADLATRSTKEAIGIRLVEARGKRRQVDYADLLQVSDQTLGRYERGERPPDVDFINKAAAHGDINPLWLLYGDLPRSFLASGGHAPSAIWGDATPGMEAPTSVRIEGNGYDLSFDNIRDATLFMLQLQEELQVSSLPASLGLVIQELLLTGDLTRGGARRLVEMWQKGPPSGPVTPG